MLIFLLFTKLVYMYSNVITSPLLDLLPFVVGISLMFFTLALHMVEMMLFVNVWRIGKRRHYSYTWFGYTGLLIVDITVVFAPHLLVADAILLDIMRKPNSIIVLIMHFLKRRHSAKEDTLLEFAKV